MHNLEIEIIQLRAQAQMVYEDQKKLLVRYLTLTGQADELERCLHSKRCLNKDLQAIREYAGPSITLVEDHVY